MADQTTVRCTFIENPAAGQWSRALTKQAVQCCARYGARVHVTRTTGRGDATRLARDAIQSDAIQSDAIQPGAAGPRADEPFHVVVALGGDGTVHEVARGMISAGVRAGWHGLFVIPAGTGNSGYRSYWGDQGWAEALAEALAAPRDLVRMLDLAHVAELDELVVLGAGAGLTAEVLAGARDVALTGPARLQAGLDRAMASHQPYPGRVVVDGVVVHEGRTAFVNVGGGPHRAWHYAVLPYSVLDDGLLDVCVVDHTVRLGDLLGMMREGRHIGVPGVFYGRGRHVVIERDDGHPLSFEHDGELIADAGSRVTVDVLPGALPVLCAARLVSPPGYGSGAGLTAA